MKPGYYWVHWSDEKFKDYPYFVVEVIEIEVNHSQELMVYIMGDEKGYTIELFKDWSKPLEEPQIKEILDGYFNRPISPGAPISTSAKQGPTIG